MEQLQITTLAPESIPYVHTVVAIAKVALKKLQPYNQTMVDVYTILGNHPESLKALRLLDSSREIVELILLSGSFKVKHYYSVQWHYNTLYLNHL